MTRINKTNVAALLATLKIPATWRPSTDLTVEDSSFELSSVTAISVGRGYALITVECSGGEEFATWDCTSCEQLEASLRDVARFMSEVLGDNVYAHLLTPALG